MMKIIGIHGLARSGKDTVAAFLCKAYGFHRQAFAECLKKDVAKMFKHPVLQVEQAHDGELYYPDDGRFYQGELDLRREIYQTWGTEGRRDIFPNYWLLRWSELALRNAQAGHTKLVVPDVRFINEAEFIRSLGGTIIVVERPQMETNNINYQHRSEQGTEEIKKTMVGNDFVLLNSGTISDLHDLLRLNDIWFKDRTCL